MSQWVKNNIEKSDFRDLFLSTCYYSSKYLDLTPTFATLPQASPCADTIIPPESRFIHR